MSQIIFCILFLINMIILFNFMNNYFFKNKIQIEKLDLLVITITIDFIVVVMVAFILALTGNYNIDTLVIILSIITISVIGFKRNLVKLSRPQKSIIELILNNKIDLLTIFFIIIISILNFVYSTEFIIGARDPGVYTNLAIYVSEHGKFFIEDSFLNSNIWLNQYITFGFNGFYSAYEEGLSNLGGLIIPQFYHLFTIAATILYDVIGYKGLIGINSFIGMLSLLTIYLFMKKISNKNIACITTILIALNPAQIWNSRINQTELFSQLIIFLSLYILFQSFENKNMVLALWAGIIIGVNSLIRIDSLITGVGLIPALIYFCFFDKGYLKFITRYIHGYIFMTIPSIIYGYYFSYPYLRYHLLQFGVLLFVNLLLVIILLLSKLILNEKVFQNSIYTKIYSLKKHISPFILGMLIVLYFYSYFVRPEMYKYFSNYFKDGFFEANSIHEFQHYVPSITMLCALAGIYYLTKINTSKVFVFIMISITYIVGYLFKPSITPEHIWASRRWIIVSIPSVIIFFSYFIYINKSKVIKTLLILFTITFFIVQSRLFIFNTMYENFGSQIQQLADKIQDDMIVFTTRFDVKIATPLKFVHNKNIYILNKDAEKSSKLIELVDRYGKVYLLSSIINYNDFLELKANGLSVSNITSGKLEGKYLEKSREGYPKKLYEPRYMYKLFEVSKQDVTKGYDYGIAGQFQTIIGEAGDYKGYKTTKEEGYIIYGPYENLPAGQYRIKFEGTIENKPNSDNKGYVEVVYHHNNNEVILKKIDLNRFIYKDKILGRVYYDIDKTINNYEFRIYLQNNKKAHIEKINITRLN